MVGWTTGLNVLLKSMPYLWEKPLATRRSLWHSIELSARSYILKIHQQPITLWSLRRETKCHVLLCLRATISTFMTESHLGCFTANLNPRGSLTTSYTLKPRRADKADNEWIIRGLTIPILAQVTIGWVVVGNWLEEKNSMYDFQCNHKRMRLRRIFRRR